MLSRPDAPGCGAVVALVLLGLAGCGGDRLKTYSVRGKVVLADGDVQQLAGSHVEFMLESDSTMRASGTIEPDGSFALQTLHKGTLLKGAPEGTYRARLILSDEDQGSRPKQGYKPVHKRFLDFKTSGLSFKVPTNGDVTVNVSQR
jgi:hypothetical protein